MLIYQIHIQQKGILVFIFLCLEFKDKSPKLCLTSLLNDTYSMTRIVYIVYIVYIIYIYIRRLVYSKFSFFFYIYYTLYIALYFTYFLNISQF